MDTNGIISDYNGGMGIYDVCAKYHIGKLKLKSVLLENGVSLRKKGKQPMNKDSFVVSDFRKVKYVKRDGFHYVAVDKEDGTRYEDYMNKGGFLTTHIEKKYGIETPSLYDRRIYYMRTGNYWWEQWFDIVEEKDVEYKIKCPYCDWGTSDEANKSGAFTHHLSSIHNISIKDFLNEYPQYYPYFKKQVSIIEKEKLLENPDNYVVCPICYKKMPKITYSHLRNVHGLGMGEFRRLYPNASIMSKNMEKQAKSAFKLCNLVVSKHRFISSYEREIGNYLSSIGVEFDANRQILIGKEIDILIPSKMVGIEFDGLKWHTEFFGKKGHKYHLEKTQKCNDSGYGLIHIFEDEYVNHKDVVLSKIRHILGKDTDLPKIGGRKIQVREILSKTAKAFLDKNHIQGFYKSSAYIGGFYNNELVAVMAFKNGNIKNECWELTRFATDPRYVYQGVGSKMFTYFVRKEKPYAVISFADRRWTLNSDNNLYTKLGFVLDSTTPPDYRYYNENVDRFKRIHKMSMSKTILNKKYGLSMDMTELEMARSLGYDRIWDCGLFKYVWRSEN